MSKIVQRERVEVLPRPRLSPAQRARILARFDGQCARLDCTETKGLEIDHAIPLALGGRNEISNYEPLCSEHHRIKTNRDIKMIAKAKRLERKQAGEMVTKNPIRGRNSFRTDLRKRMDGTVLRTPRTFSSSTSKGD